MEKSTILAYFGMNEEEWERYIEPYVKQKIDKGGDENAK